MSHSGMCTQPSVELGGYYFAGHSLFAASLEQVRRIGIAPSLVLLTGSSAGGIGTLLHADFVADFFPSATVRSHLRA